MVAQQRVSLRVGIVGTDAQDLGAEIRLRRQSAREHVFSEDGPIVVDVVDVDHDFEQRVVVGIEEIHVVRSGVAPFAGFHHQDVQGFLFPIQFSFNLQKKLKKS